jgi:hypothetical protein
MVRTKYFRGRRSPNIEGSNRFEGNEGKPTAEPIGNGVGNLRRQSGLADAAGAGQGQRGNRLIEPQPQGSRRRPLIVPPDMPRPREGERFAIQWRRIGQWYWTVGAGAVGIRDLLNDASSTVSVAAHSRMNGMVNQMVYKRGGGC